MPNCCDVCTDIFMKVNWLMLLCKYFPGISVGVAYNLLFRLNCNNYFTCDLNAYL